MAPPILEVVARTDRYAVIDKPAGLLSVPGIGFANQDSVAGRARAVFPGAEGPLIVHRLDWETSGLMVLALDPRTHRALGRQFERRQVGKVYIAVLEGTVKRGDRGRIDLPMRPDVENRPRQVIDFEHGREAVTDWEVLVREAGRTRVRLVPLTGRTHQLRMHAADERGLGCPIAGDRLYGRPCPEGRMLLHASGLAFTDPGTDERVTFTSDPPF